MEVAEMDVKLKLIRIDELVERTGLSRTTIWRLTRAAQFPAPLKLSKQRRSWIEAEVAEWLRMKFEDATR
jgi:prophage regulatory protein